MRKLLSLAFLLLSALQFIHAQEGTTLLKGKVKNDSTDELMTSVHVLNLSSVEGVITDRDGNFEIAVQAQDTLYFSYLGYKPLKVAVSNDMIKFGAPVFRLTQLSFALEEVIVRPYQLTGYLDIDVRKVPLNPAGRYNIPGLPQSGYEAGNRNRSSISKAIGSLFNLPIFSTTSSGKTPNKCGNSKMREDDQIKVYWGQNSTERYWCNFWVLTA